MTVPEDRFKCRRCRGGEESDGMVRFECAECRREARMPDYLAAKLDFTRPVLCIGCKRERERAKASHVRAKENEAFTADRLRAATPWKG